MDVFIKSPVVQFIIIILTPIAFIYAVVVSIIQLRNRARKELTYAKWSYSLISRGIEQIDDLSITYKSEKISNFTVTNVGIWNSGNISLLKDNIVPAKPIKICIGGDYEILDATMIVGPESSTCYLTKEPGGQYIDVDIDFIGKKQYMVFQVLHTGSQENIGIRGMLIDGKITSYDQKRVYSRLMRIVFSKFTSSFLMGSIFVLLSVILAPTFLQMAIPEIISSLNPLLSQLNPLACILLPIAVLAFFSIRDHQLHPFEHEYPKELAHYISTPIISRRSMPPTSKE